MRTSNIDVYEISILRKFSSHLRYIDIYRS